jgi:hypothetical protein
MTSEREDDLKTLAIFCEQISQLLSLFYDRPSECLDASSVKHGVRELKSRLEEYLASHGDLGSEPAVRDALLHLPKLNTRPTHLWHSKIYNAQIDLSHHVSYLSRLDS